MKPIFLAARLAALILAFTALPLQAQTAAERRQRYFEAADRIDHLVAASALQGSLPRSSDPEVAAVLRALTNWEIVYGNDSFTIADMEPLGEIASRGTAILRHYAFHGTNPGDSQAAIIAQQNRNTVTYEPEIMALLAFQLEANAQWSRVTAVGIDERRRSGERIPDGARMRSSLETLLQASIACAVDHRISPENRLLISNALGRNATIFAEGLSLTQRRTVLAAARNMRPRAGPQAGIQLDLLLEALASNQCTGFCAI